MEKIEIAWMYNEFKELFKATLRETMEKIAHSLHICTMIKIDLTIESKQKNNLSTTGVC